MTERPGAGFPDVVESSRAREDCSEASCEIFAMFERGWCQQQGLVESNQKGETAKGETAGALQGDRSRREDAEVEARSGGENSWKYVTGLDINGRPVRERKV